MKGEYSFDYPSFEVCSKDCLNFINSCL